MWLLLPRSSEDYVQGVTAFLRNAFSKYAVGTELRCPCRTCHNLRWHTHNVIFDHLICYGASPDYVQWILEVSALDSRNKPDDTNIGFGDDLATMLCAIHGDVINNENEDEIPPNADAKKFRRLVEEGKQPLYEGCTNFSTLSFIVKLNLWKCSGGVTDSAFSELLEILRSAFPHANIPKSSNAAKKVIKDLGLHYEKIHACPNDCMIYWGVDVNEEKCSNCGLSRWKTGNTNGDVGEASTAEAHNVPAKVMRYFPLKPRLQRLFMSKDFSKLMRWHALERKKDGKLRHAADGLSWKKMDEKYPAFAAEIRNVRLGIASDGFNPYRTMTISHSTWPIILVNYNLPPWLSMKAENLILSTLISGPKSPGNNIDVYMQPLISELKDLWKEGLETYDMLAGGTFQLHASVLWTISDFPGYAMLSGWSTKGKLACPTCNYGTTSMYLNHSKKVCYMGHRKFLCQSHKYRIDKKRFNGQIEMGEPATMLSGRQVEQHLCNHVNRFGKQTSKGRDDSPWKKKSILFELPYWVDNLHRHNLDVMHIEKNVFDSIVGTLLDIRGKSKDHLKARKDLEALCIRKTLHPIMSTDGGHYEYRAASYQMENREKEIFCTVLKNVKIPYGYASNISRCVHMKEKKLLGYKSHDAHFILQYLLQFAVSKCLKPAVALPLIRLSAFYRGICSKVIDLEVINQMQQEITDILCQFEIIFPPTFFDIMVHLQIHLCQELELGGPVHTRWMYPIESFLGKLKSYVRNKSKPEGSIAEGYLAEECLTFCSRFLDDEGNSIRSGSTVFDRSVSLNGEYHLGSRKNKNGKAIHLDDDTFYKAHRYVLFNADIAGLDSFFREHRDLVDSQVMSKKYKRERTHTYEFHNWLKLEAAQREGISRELACLAKGPNRVAKRFSGYVVNGYRFHTKRRDAKCTTQNSGVFLNSLTNSYASSRDENPILGDVGYYGAIEEIIQVDYWGAYNITLFKCCWYEKEKAVHGLIRVNFNKLTDKTEPFILAAQAHQVFYVEDPVETGLHFVVQKACIEHSDSAIAEVEDMNPPVMYFANAEVDTLQDFRDDLPTRIIQVNANEVNL